jgi:hypothetical protein
VYRCTAPCGSPWPRSCVSQAAVHQTARGPVYGSTFGRTALAWNIKSLHAMMMHRNDDPHAFIRMELKRFLDTVIRIPAMVIVRARAIVIRLVAYTASINRFFTAWAATERVQFGARYG